MIELTINDKTVKVAPGTSILRAALDNGIYIPNLCYDKRLKPYGGCRLCIVEIKGQRKLSTSCSTPAREGQVVYTETPKIIKARKALLELLLVHHPLDCPVCDKAGECTLQDLAFKYGAAQSRFSGIRKHDPERLDAPIVERNPNRCILCGKCVKICSEHQGVGAINFIGRGFKTKVSPAFDETLDCEFCGQCIDVCPVGALNSRHYRHASRAWYMEEREVVCPYCGCGCTTNVSIREGKIVRARGKEDVGINKGDLCSKGRFGFDYIASPKRLTTPLIRKNRSNGSFEEVSWDEALSFIAERLSDIKAKHGPHSIGAIGSQRCSMEDNFMLQKFMREGIGADSIDSAALFGYAKAQKAAEWAFGKELHPITWDAPLKADFILAVESDITSVLPVWGLSFLEAQRNGATLVVADAKNTKLSRHSTSWLRLTPGSGVALLNGVTKVILDEGLYDKKAASLPLFEALVNCMNAYTPALVERETGIPKEEIIALARSYAASKKRLIAITTGSSDNTKNLNVILSAANLVLLMGDDPDTLQIPAEYSNTLGMWAVGIRPFMHGKDAYDMLYRPNGLKALYIMGENPLTTFPQSSLLEQNLKALDFLVVQDIFMTETAALADVVLPAASWAEKEGTLMAATGELQQIHKLLPETGQSLPDWQIFLMLGKAMQKDLGVKDLSGIRALLPDGVHPKGAGSDACSFNPATYKLHEAPDNEYPLTLVTSAILQHSGAFSVLSRNLDTIVANPYLQIHPEDAGKYGVAHEQFVKVSSRRGELYVKAMVSDEVPAGTVFAPIHFAAAPIHQLTYPSLNGGIPLVAVKIEP